MKSLLLVEDDDRFRASLTLALQGRGFLVTDINSERAYFALKSKIFNYAILDLQLERGNSLSLIPIIKRHSPACRILILTGFGTVTAAVRAIKLGADNFIHKPAAFKTILEALEEDHKKLEDLPISPPTLARQEREYIEYVLDRCQGNISKAARELGIHRQSLQRKLKTYVPNR